MNTAKYFVVILLLTPVASIFIGRAILMATACLKPVTTISIGLLFSGVSLCMGIFSRKRIHENSYMAKHEQNIVIQKKLGGLGAVI